MMTTSIIENTYNEIKERLEYMPADYTSSRVTKVETASTIDPKQFLLKAEDIILPLFGDCKLRLEDSVHLNL